jgi:hypothetical protein
MRRTAKTIVLTLAFFLLSLTPIDAQNAGGTNANAKAKAAAPIPSPSLAPDEVMERLSGLVHSGKYAEARQLTTGLLMAYPEDQRLIKVKALLDKAPASTTPASPAQDDNTSTNNSTSVQPTANSTELTGMDKVDYSALIELVRQAQQTTDLPEQTQLLTQFMQQSSLFLRKHPEQTVLWQFRAVSAISLNAPMAGFEAGQKLLAAGAADSNDPKLLQLLAKLKLLGWMDRQEAEGHQLAANNERKQQAASAEAERLKEEHDQYTLAAAHSHGFSYGYGHLTLNENDMVYVADDETIHLNRSDVRQVKSYCVGKNYCGLYFYPKDGRKFFFLAITEAGVANKTATGATLLPSVMGNMVVARWKFVSSDNKTLIPPPTASGAN